MARAVRRRGEGGGAGLSHNPRATCFHSRRAPEHAMAWLYRHDRSLRPLYRSTAAPVSSTPAIEPRKSLRISNRRLSSVHRETHRGGKAATRLPGLQGPVRHRNDGGSGDGYRPRRTGTDVGSMLAWAQHGDITRAKEENGGVGLFTRSLRGLHRTAARRTFAGPLPHGSRYLHQQCSTFVKLRSLNSLIHLMGAHQCSAEGGGIADGLRHPSRPAAPPRARIPCTR